MSELQVPSSSRDATTPGMSEVQHGRTDGRTHEELLTARNHLTDSYAHTRVQDFDDWVTPGDVIAAGELWRTDQRHERVRSGEREPIEPHVRAAVWFRDRGQCEECVPGWPSGDVLHLDHIKPWSAGGADTTDNLRLLCERHNLERSNYVDFARPKRPATWWCANCYSLDEHVWEYTHPLIVCPTHGSAYTPTKVRCRVARAFTSAWRRGEPAPTWHQRPMFTEPDLIAYCAHCDAPGLTEVVL